MKNRGKLICVLVLSSFLLLLTLYYSRMAGTVVLSASPSRAGAGPALSARIPSGREEQTVGVFLAGEDQSYLFLPCYAEGKRLKLDAALQDEAVQDAVVQETESGRTANGGGQNDTRPGTFGLRVQNGMSLWAGGRQLTVLTGSRIPSVFLTLKQELSWLEADQENIGSGAAAIVSPEGEVLYSGSLEQIHGRGNTSWEQEKKPFSIRLEDSVSLFGLRSARKFSLVSSTDRTFLRNTISNEMGEQLGLITAGRQLVELYINGAYQGVYEFCEKIDTGLTGIYDLEQDTEELNRSRRPPQQLTTGVFLDDWNHSVTGKWWDLAVDPADITGGYLLEAEDSTRYAAGLSGFTLNSGGYFVPKSPELLSEKQYAYLSAYLQDCETAMVESVGAEDYGRLPAYIDLPSFRAKYLLEEVSKNIDCSASSQFFYKDRNSLLTAGPPWDYDWAYGVVRSYGDIDFADPEGFSARDVPGAFVWWQLLYFNDAFYRDMTQTYRTQLYPWLGELIASRLPEWEDWLADSAVMDYARWDTQGPSRPEEYRQEYHGQVAAVAGFLAQRKEFLAREWA